MQATIEVQRAARGVAWENAMLRRLLGAKGVEREEVEAFLRGARDGEGGSAGLGGGNGGNGEYFVLGFGGSCRSC